MIRTLTEFVEELRAVGIPVSMVEAIDAAEACRFADLSSPEALRAALGATMVKNARHYPAFEVAFDVFFGLRAPVRETAGEEGPAGALPGPEGVAGAGGTAGGGEEELFEAIVAALAAGDLDGLRRLVATAVTRLAGMEPGRPVGGRYYLYRVMRRLDADRLRARLLAAAVPGEPEDPLAARLAAEAADRLVATFRRELRREILRRLVADRGAADVARTLRVPLVEDLDLLHATREELARIERAVAPLARKLATRLAQRRRRGARGRLDVRRTIRRSLAHGGVLLDPRFRPPRRSKPELVLLCDLSGSMATFARFTMQLAYAVAGEFSRVRSFAFVDGIDEVTGFLDRRWGFPESLARMGSEANLVRRDGHSDYGAALGEFWDRFAEAVGPRSTVIVTGDARNNYRRDGREYLGRIAERSRALFWLNPEARRYWNTGDSIMASYASVCDIVAEVRTLRQLEAFVERAALPAARRVYGAPAVP